MSGDNNSERTQQEEYRCGMSDNIASMLQNLNMICLLELIIHADNLECTVDHVT